MACCLFSSFRQINLNYGKRLTEKFINDIIKNEQKKGENAKMTDFYFDSFDGKKIFVREWLPTCAPVGVVQIVHGMAEHSGRYDALGKYLAESGFVVFADDHRAHGNTDKDTLGYCDGDVWGDTLRDLQLLNKLYRQKYDGLNYTVFGHSYGSFLTQRYMQIADDSLYDGVILSGSAQMQGAQVGLGRIVASLGKPTEPSYTIKKLSFDAYNKKFDSGDFISSIPAESQRYAQDGMCGYVCSNNFYKCFFGGLKGMYGKSNLAKLNLDKPVLIMSGDKDPVGEFGKSVKKLYGTYKKQGVKNLYLRLFENNRHEVLNDLSAEQAKKLIADFALNLTLAQR